MAVQAVKSGAMNSYQAARHFHVPRGTVAYRIYKKTVKFELNTPKWE